MFSKLKQKTQEEKSIASATAKKTRVSSKPVSCMVRIKWDARAISSQGTTEERRTCSSWDH